MKRLFTLLAFTTLGTAVNSQRLLVEDFNYPTGQLTNIFNNPSVSGGVWKSVSSDAITDASMVGPGNLTYPNYFTGPTATSNSARLDSATANQSRSIEDVYADFTPVLKTSNSTVYGSFLINFREIDNLSANSTNNTGDYFMSFATSNAPTDFRARVFVKKGITPNTVQFGISPTSFNATTSPILYSLVDRDASVTHLITFAFQFVNGNNNDVVKLFIDKPFSQTEPAPDAMLVFNGAEPADLSRIVIRQATANSPKANVDAIVVATSYADATLPLNLTSFKAAFNGKATTLKWTTENEVSVSGFSVEKSLDGVTFSQVDFVTAKNSAGKTEYSVIDSKVKSGMSYYRLKQLDKSGTYKFSSVEAVRNNVSIKAELFPNPTRGNLTVSHGMSNTGAAIRVMNMEGKLMKSYPVKAGASQTLLNVNELIKGNYILVFENNGSKSLSQFTKQ